MSGTGKSDEERLQELAREAAAQIRQLNLEAERGELPIRSIMQDERIILSALREARQQEYRSFKECNPDAK